MWPEEGLHRHMHILWQAPGSQVPRHNLQRLNGALHLQAATNAVRHTMHYVLARLNLHRFCCTNTVYEWACRSPIGAGAEHSEHANKLDAHLSGGPLGTCGHIQQLCLQPVQRCFCIARHLQRTTQSSTA